MYHSESQQHYQPDRAPKSSHRYQPYKTDENKSTKAVDPEKANKLHLEQLQQIFNTESSCPHFQWVNKEKFLKIAAIKYTKYSQDWQRQSQPQQSLPVVTARPTISSHAFLAEWSKVITPRSTPHNLETYTLILLNTLLAAPFGYSKKPELKQFQLKKSFGNNLLSSQHRFEIFKALDERGRHGNMDAFWLWLSQEVIVDNVMNLFDSHSYLPVQRYFNRFQGKYTELTGTSPLMTLPTPETLLQMITSHFVVEHKYLKTFLFPDCAGRMVVLKTSNDESLLQFEDTNQAEISILQSIQRLSSHPPMSVYSYKPSDCEDLNSKQQSVMAAISSKKLTIVQGQAGTGKSHLLKVVTRWLEKIGVDYQCVAPYHSNVTRLKELGVAAPRTRTCTSWRLGFERSGPLNSKNDPYLHKGGVLLIDEGGLVGAHEHKVFLHWLLLQSANRRMVLFGDIQQLPPVTGGSVMTALMSLLPECVVQLEKVERVQSNESSLLELSSNILQNYPGVPDSSEIKVLETHEEFFAHFDFQTSILLTMSKKERDRWNDLLITHHKPNRKKYGIKYFVGMRLIVTKTDKPDLDALEIPVMSACNYDIIPYTKDAIGDFIKSYKKVNPETKLEEWWCELEIKRKGKPARMMVPTQYVEAGYAVTLHKFQGNECDNVFVLVDSWSLQEHGDSRWMYTAVTRAKKKLFLVTTHQRGLQHYQKVVLKPAKCLLHTTLIPAYFQADIKNESYDGQWTPAASDHDSRVERDGFQPNEPFNLQLVSKSSEATMTYPNFVRHLQNMYY